MKENKRNIIAGIIGAILAFVLAYGAWNLLSPEISRDHIQGTDGTVLNCIEYHEVLYCEVK